MGAVNQQFPQVGITRLGDSQLRVTAPAVLLPRPHPQIRAHLPAPLESSRVSDRQHVRQRHAVEGISAVLPTELQESAASTWMRCVMVAYEKTKGGLHITADRFTRYCEEGDTPDRSEEHTSELQSLRHLVCRL